MTPDLRTFADALSAAEASAAHILQLLQSALVGNRHATLAISGGSTPKLMFTAMAKAGFDWKHVHLFFVDERAVPPDHEQSNYRMADEYLIRPAKIRHVHRIPSELEPKQAAKRYASDVREHFQIGDGELPHFDVMHLGVGPDGHTASLFPGEPLVEDRQGIAAAVYVEKIPQWRITLLPGVLLAARNMVVVAAGPDKKEALQHVLREPFSPLTYPAQILIRQSRKPVFFVDKAALP